MNSKQIFAESVKLHVDIIDDTSILRYQQLYNSLSVFHYNATDVILMTHRFQYFFKEVGDKS